MAFRTAVLLAMGLTTLAIGAGCSGAKSYVRADQSAYPISLSNGLRGSDGQLIPDARKSPVGAFETHWSSWTAVWTLIPLSNRTRDISEEVNQQVKKAGGDAIVGLDVKVTQCGWNYLTILGILPGCDNVSVTGHIVKVAAAQ
jgi:hypothetical protein